MSLMEGLQFSFPFDSRLYNTYYFINFESKIQVVFNEVSMIKNVPSVMVNVMKGNIYLKGDYFIPLKSSDILQLNCKELLKKLKEISCIRSVEVDSNYNLIFCLRRSMLYIEALCDVLKHSDSYGMFKNNKSVLVLTDFEKSKSFDNLRNKLLAEHIVCILTANNVRVYYNECTPEFKIENSNSKKIMCSDSCSLNDVCKELEEKVKTSQWKSDSEVNNNLCLDAKKYIESNSLTERYGKSIDGIMVSKDNMPDDLHRTCYIKHLIDDHMSEKPDYILHIASQGQNRNIYKSGILLGMLEKLGSTQVYVFNQSVQYKGKTGTCADDFIHDHKIEIEQAMTHKYNTCDPNDQTWASRIESLVDTAVKFDFLKMNHSSILNLRPPNSRDGEKNYGIFVQYNFARLSNLFRNFDMKVQEGLYHPLLCLEEVDFSLLKLEEEWNLFHYVLSFPKLVQTVVESLMSDNEVKNRYRLNKVCLMLQELCQYLSLYYSRIRILSGPQPHMQKTMNARLWLLKGIHQIFKNSFILLNVHGLDQM